MQKHTDFYHQFRLKVRLLRMERNLTVRALAKKMNVSQSYITRLEQGLLFPVDEMMDRFKQVLQFEFDFCATSEAMFKGQFKKVYEDILYVRLEQTHPVIEALYDKRHMYENSQCFYQYYLLIFMYTQHFRKYLEIEEDLFNKLKIIEELFTDEEKELLYVEFGAYYLNKGDRTLSFEYLNKQLSFAQNEHLIGFNYHIQGIIHSENFHEYNVALKAFEKAAYIFQRVNNFTRLMQTKIILQRIYIYMNRFDDFMELYNETNRYAIIKNIPFLSERSKQNMARYHLAHRNYKEALDILNSYKSEFGEYYCFKAYVLFQLTYGIEALHIIKTAKNDFFDDRYGHYHLALRAIEHALVHGKDETYLNYLKQFADSTLEQGDFMLVRMAIKLYTEALEEKRLYKEAFIYSDKLLEALRTIMQ